MSFDPALSRRRFLLVAGAALTAPGLAACGAGTVSAETLPAAISRVESTRRKGGARTVTHSLVAKPTRLDLGGVQVDTWAYGDELPGPRLRVTAGDVLRADLRNELPADTTIHWHGLALRNDMDGVPQVTQPPVPPGASFRYEFTVPDPGTHWYHPHVGLQLDRGLYAPLIVDDPAEPGRYDAELVVVLDDWLDGVAGTPDEQLDKLRQGGMHHGWPQGMAERPTSLVGGDGGDVAHPHLVANGRVATAPRSFEARPGQRVRIRLINAAADTAFRVALGGHRLTVTASDGFDTEPVETDAVLIGMGERYDLLVTLGDGAFPLVAAAEGKPGRALLVLRTSPQAAPPPADVRPAQLSGRVVTLADLRSTPGHRLPARRPDRTLTLRLGMSHRGYEWLINGRAFDPRRDDLPIQEGERVRLRFVNQTMMFHPMHLHGHTGQVVRADGAGPRKDTVVALPMRTVELDLDADNPGRWMVHCHNAYHAEAGMMALMGYTA
ncbi:putative oxidase (copper-binding protein) [Longimycelium tulufanense]|uniref:Putative oxidase (Copper-binding protein) n=1 Tax=Longimycelium tulufanense TaxID=907463 RepID=A0A8J3CI81_9PSEU|nr:multicopper oxidase family protein [Longimycelium tulufanense]GGM70778.1 putative oxidase (copper-binding protein) [Longimycelium tulufanense]